MAQAVQAVEIEAVALNQPKNNPQQPETENGPKPAPAEAGVADVPVANAPEVGKLLTVAPWSKKSRSSDCWRGRAIRRCRRPRLGVAGQQQSDGRWELHRGYDNPGRENLATDTGNFARLAFVPGQATPIRKANIKRSFAKG